MGAVGRGLRSACVAIVSLTAVGAMLAIGANYTMTQGTGTTFASAVISGANYVEFLICDATAGASQCAGVNGSGQIAVAGPVTVVSGGIASGAVASGAIVSGGDVTEGTTAETTVYAGSGGCTVVACLKGVYSAVNSAIPAGTNTIGGVFSAYNTYNTVAASQTTQALTGGGGGATGDYLSHCTVVPATTAPGVVTILDNATAIYSFVGGGTYALSNPVPFTIPVGAKSTSGAWKVTTGANVSVVCVGKFT